MLTKKEKISYGLGDLSSNIILAAISFYLLYFMVNVAGLDAGLAGLVFIVGKAWDAFTDYFMGIISDKTKSPFGKRRVYMLFGAIPYGLCFIFLWICPFNENTTQLVKFIYYASIYMLFNTVWTIVYVPYNALTANMTDDYDERTSLNGVRIVFANIGLLLGAAVFALLAEGEGSLLAVAFGSVKKGYFAAGAIFGITALIVMILCSLGVKERYDQEFIYNKTFITTIKEFFKLKEFRNMMMHYLLSMVGFDIIMAVFLFFINDALGLGSIAGGEISMIFIAIPLIVAIATATFWVRLASKYNNIKVYKIAVIEITLSLLMCLIIPSYDKANPLPSFLFLSILVIAVGIGMSAIQILPFASVPDVIEVDEYTYGSRREGAYYGIVQFIYKMASGISIAIVGWVLDIFGYIESVDGKIIDQPESALFTIRIIIGILPGLIFLFSIWFGKRANLDRERFNDIKKKIALHKNN